MDTLHLASKSLTSSLLIWTRFFFSTAIIIKACKLSYPIEFRSLVLIVFNFEKLLSLVTCVTESVNIYL